MNSTFSASASPSPSVARADDRLLRAVLRIDSVVTGLNGLAYALVAAPLAALLGGTVPLLIGLGAFLVIVAVVLMLVSRGRPMARPAVGALIAVNIAWVIASVGVAGLADWPTALGRAWVVLQAVVVLVFVACEVIGLRRSRG